jgi:4-hydroxysphinganine ceramide fatty acyl 2-hydroxylase
MDALSQAPWWHPMAVWLPILYATGAWVDPHEPLWGVAVRFFWGLVLWSVTEYGVHRFLFHLRPQSKALVSLHFLAHGYHHLLPLDGVRLVMPTTVAALVGLTTLGFLVLWYGSLALALASWWGFASGYIVYDTCHYWLHSPFVPQWRWAEELRRRHMAHHYGAPDRNFAISPLAKLWDVLWGTY